MILIPLDRTMIELVTSKFTFNEKNNKHCQ